MGMGVTGNCTIRQVTRKAEDCTIRHERITRVTILVRICTTSDLELINTFVLLLYRSVILRVGREQFCLSTMICRLS